MQTYACMCTTGSPAEISTHSYELARLVYTQLSSWRHSNGRPVAELYHQAIDFLSSDNQGPIVNFNLLRADSSYVGFTQVKHLLRYLSRIVTLLSLLGFVETVT